MIPVVGGDSGEGESPNPRPVVRVQISESDTMLGHRPDVVEGAVADSGEEPTVLLTTFTPDRHVQYFRDLHDLTYRRASSDGW